MNKKVSKLLVFVYVVMLMVSIVSVVKADGIQPTLPTSGSFTEVTQGGGKLITIMFNIIAVAFIGTAGFASMQLVMGQIQQNPMSINHARAAIFSSFIGLGGLAIIPKLASVILNTFGFAFQG